VSQIHIHSGNVGRVAERIVANELESRGFRVSDLNKEGTSANADLLAVKNGRSWQIQVKGSTHDRGCWFNYGHCTEEHINHGVPMFNRAKSYYQAQVVALVCVEAASKYLCVLLPIGVAEEIARINIEREYKRLNKDGSTKRPGKVYCDFDYEPPKLKDKVRLESLRCEQRKLQAYVENWALDDPTIFPSDS
jgi:hypothetical protein